MDSLDVNKAVAAVLVAGIAFFITGLLGDNLVYEENPAKPAIAIQGAQTPAGGGGTPAPVGPAPIAPLLASADVQKGDTFVHQVCTACHTVDQGGKAIIGPNLYDVVGGPHDHMAGFDYSPALEKFKGQPWTYAELNKWLFDPQTYAPGTRMTFTGIKNTGQRADVIAYLRTLSPHPDPLPAPEAPPKAAPTAGTPAAGTASAAPAAGTAPPAAPAGRKAAPAVPASSPPTTAAPAAGTAPPATPAGGKAAPAAPGSSPAATAAPANAHEQTPSAGTQAGGAASAPPTAGATKP